MKYRIKQVGKFYYPQIRFLFWYRCFKGGNIYGPCPVRCSSLENAQDYIKNYKESLKYSTIKKIHKVK
jgi:hypothetical protein